MNAIQFLKRNGLKKAMTVVENAPSNAESFQDGYYFRTKPVFEFHNGFHPIWNLTDNNGEYFKKCGFDPVTLPELRGLVARLQLIERIGGPAKARIEYESLLKLRNFNHVELNQALEEFDLIFGAGK
ncbi:hypothetical protein [Acinetobacter courvalinii]|uniref:hypothetical protein n=1 Tax=Acinetobacter courvalinii TaxID=280147 RepID=UPI001901CDA6|nr:hypothetical protein [Acinetobacter courvalinii]MBJ9958382.1 hypothetical protein [Acinetobacter courvalinii]